MDATSPTPHINQQDWDLALTTLRELLSKQDQVSTTVLRRRLEQKGLQNSREVIFNLRFRDGEVGPDGTPIAQPFCHRGRSFYTREAFERLGHIEDQEAERAEDSEPEPESDQGEECERRVNRREEARLVRYVQSALEDIYAGEFAPDAVSEFVFDVHNERGGKVYENVDLIAVDWRSETRVEIITVEVKLDLTPAYCSKPTITLASQTESGSPLESLQIETTQRVSSGLPTPGSSISVLIRASEYSHAGRHVAEATRFLLFTGPGGWHRIPGNWRRSWNAIGCALRPRACFRHEPPPDDLWQCNAVQWAAFDSRVPASIRDRIFPVWSQPAAGEDACPDPWSKPHDLESCACQTTESVCLRQNPRSSPAGHGRSLPQSPTPCHASTSWSTQPSARKCLDGLGLACQIPPFLSFSLERQVP